MRLNRFIAQAGICSRRKADELITMGLVRVDGKTVTEMGLQVDPEKQRVLVENKEIKPPKRKLYLAFNKPKGVLTTMDDPQNRESIYHYLTDMPRVFPVGRLDKDSEGLLILTDDGDFANMLMHPRYKLEKTYRVHIKGNATAKDIEKLETGVYLEGRKTQPCSITLIKQLSGEAEYLMKIKEGRKRQIRNMFLIIGCSVKKLLRISMGSLKLGDLKPGTFRIIGEKEINEIKKYFQKPKEDIAGKKKLFSPRKKDK